MDRLVSRGAMTRNKIVAVVALVAVAFPPPGTTSASPAIPVAGNSHGRPWGAASHQESAVQDQSGAHAAE